MTESLDPTPYAVWCPEHGRVFLTEAEYNRQMDNPTVHWKCPRFVAEPAHAMGPCGASCAWDDDWHDAAMEGAVGAAPASEEG